MELDSTFNWKKLPDKRERIVFLVALVVFVFGFFKACWFPSQHVLSELKEQHEALLVQKQALEKVEAFPVSLKKNIPSSSKDSDFMKKAASFPGSTMSTLIALFSNPTLLRGTKVKNVTFGDPLLRGEIVKEAFQLHLSGSFLSIGRYVESLEAEPLPFVIQKITIETPDEKNSSVAAQIEGSVFRRRK